MCSPTHFMFYHHTSLSMFYFIFWIYAAHRVYIYIYIYLDVCDDSRAQIVHTLQWGVRVQAMIQTDQIII
jgi:hypothetical protein